MFDTPLFAVGRDSQFRKFCKSVVSAKYQPVGSNPIKGREYKSKYKQLQ